MLVISFFLFLFRIFSLCAWWSVPRSEIPSEFKIAPLINQDVGARPSFVSNPHNLSICTRSPTKPPPLIRTKKGISTPTLPFHQSSLSSSSSESKRSWSHVKYQLPPYFQRSRACTDKCCQLDTNLCPQTCVVKQICLPTFIICWRKISSWSLRSDEINLLFSAVL